MVSSSIIYTCLVLMGLLLIDSMHASSSVKKSSNQDGINLSLKKRAVENNNDDIPDEYEGIIYGEHQLASRGARLPSEAILLGKRRLPAESILLGKRRLPAESILLGKRRLPAESILLGKRRLPVEAVLLGRREMHNEHDLVSKRR